MLTLSTTDYVAGVASVASKLAITIAGMELSGSTETYKVLYGPAFLPNAAASLYDPPASTVAFVKYISVVNTDSSSRTFTLYVNGTTAQYTVFGPITLPAGYSAVFAADGWGIYSDQGQKLGVGATGATGSAGAGVTDGDKGDITVSSTGTVWTIDPAVITLAKMANIATDSLIGRDTAASGVPENILLNATLEMDGSGNLRRAALTGDVTASAGNNATTVANNAVTYAKMQDVSATSRLLGRITAGAGDPEELTAANVKTILALAQADITGLGTGDSPQHLALNLGNASDTTLTRVAAGRMAVEGREVPSFDGWIVKAADESVTSSTVIQNDDDFFFTATTGKVFYIEFFLMVTGSAAGDIKFDFGEDATIRGVFFLNRLTIGDVGLGSPVESQQGTTIAAGTATTARGVYIAGMHTGAGGTFRLRWCQSTSDATATKILQNSVMRYRQLN